jgi:hypothetical protein
MSANPSEKIAWHAACYIEKVFPGPESQRFTNSGDRDEMRDLRKCDNIFRDGVECYRRGISCPSFFMSRPHRAAQRLRSTGRRRPGRPYCTVTPNLFTAAIVSLDAGKSVSIIPFSTCGSPDNSASGSSLITSAKVISVLAVHSSIFFLPASSNRNVSLSFEGDPSSRLISRCSITAMHEAELGAAK